jgi:hypothetical protein
MKLLALLLVRGRALNDADDRRESDARKGRIVTDRDRQLAFATITSRV